MPKIDKHISQLLYDHECVIVPELGGFLTSYEHARIHPVQHTFSPPEKKIAFNVYLKQNDGLLANALAFEKQISYPAALKEIEGYVEKCRTELDSGRKFIIEEVGMLFRDVETNIRFEPFNNKNYLKDAFGLSQIQYLPVQHSEFEQQVEKQLREFISLRPSQPLPRTPLILKKVRLNLVNTLLLTGSILWFCVNLYIVSPGNMNLASLNPFRNHAATSVQKPIPAPQVYTQPAVIKPETVFVRESMPVETIENTNSSAAGKLDAAISEKAFTPDFYIIAGAFKSMANAQKLQAQLKSQGFTHASVIENKEGRKLVTYDGFATREEAFSELNRLKALDKEGWIYRSE